MLLNLEASKLSITAFHDVMPSVASAKLVTSSELAVSMYLYIVYAYLGVVATYSFFSLLHTEFHNPNL